MEYTSTNVNPEDWIGSLIKYKFLYSNEDAKLGIVVKVTEDMSFVYNIHIVASDGNKDQMPYSLMAYELLS